MSGAKTLAELSPGERGTVARVDGDPTLAQQLGELGLIPGVEVELVRVAPLGDPLELSLMGYHLSLRRADARVVELQTDA